MMTVFAIQTLAGKLDTGIGSTERKMAESIFAGAFDMHFMTADGGRFFPHFQYRREHRKNGLHCGFQTDQNEQRHPVV